MKALVQLLATPLHAVVGGSAFVYAAQGAISWWFAAGVLLAIWVAYLHMGISWWEDVKKWDALCTRVRENATAPAEENP